MDDIRITHNPQPPVVDSGQSQLLDFRTCAGVSGIPEVFLRRMRADGRLPVVAIGGRVFIERATVDQLIEAGREPASADPAPA